MITSYAMNNKATVKDDPVSKPFALIAAYLRAAKLKTALLLTKRQNYRA